MPGFKMTIGGAGRAPLRTSSNNSTVALFMEDVAGPQSIRKAPEAQIGRHQDKGGQGEDSLDAFMASIADEVARPQTSNAPKKAKAAWEELQTEDPVVSYYEAYEKGERGIIKPRAGKEILAQPDAMDDEQGAGASDDEEEGGDRRLKPIEPLPRIDHSLIQYAPVQKDFYRPHPEISSLEAESVVELRKELRISATGSGVPTPVVSFAHLGLPEKLMDGIRLLGYARPTAIQAQAIPAALSGRDVIGIAETGSGKTVAYLLPMLVHCAAQPELQKGEGPIGLVLCPTRELAIQIEKETFRFGKPMGLGTAVLCGGLSKYQQFRTIKAGSEIAVATPGRMIDIVKMKGCNMERCTFVVLDEADRMLHMGFEHQMRSIVQNVRPARQTLLFSATFPPKIEQTCTDLLQTPVRITIGRLGQAAEAVRESIEVLTSEEEKWPWLAKRVDALLGQGQLLIFCKSRQGSEDLARRFADELQRGAAVLHGDLDQDSRVRVMDSVRRREVDVLVATDLAARGLDVPSIRTVVSYDVARDLQTHTHRVGRTGRAGAEGDAFTLLVADGQGRRAAAQLLGHLERAGAPAPAELLALALQHPPCRAARLAAGRRGRAPGEPAPGPGAAGAAGAAGAPAACSRSRSRSRSRSPASPPPTP